MGGHIITVGITQVYYCFGAVIQPYSHFSNEIEQIEVTLFSRS